MLMATIEGVDHVVIPMSEYVDIRALVDAAKHYVSVMDDMAEDREKPMAYTTTTNWVSHALVTQAYAELRATTILSWLKDQEHYV